MMMMRRTKKHHSMLLTPEQIFTPEQLHFHQQQQEEEQEQQQELDTEELETEELDTEDPLITPSASIAIVEGTEEMEMEMEERPVDVREREEFERLFQNGCCERKCHLQFSEEYLRRVRWDMQELSKDQLEMAVMGQFIFALVIMTGKGATQTTGTGIRRYNHF